MSEDDYFAKYKHHSLKIPYDIVDRWREDDYELVLVEEGVDNPETSMFRLFVFTKPELPLREVTGDVEAYARRIKEQAKLGEIREEKEG